MRRGHYIGIILLTILSVGITHAQETNSEELFEEKITEETLAEADVERTLGSAGITPDSFLSGIDDAFDRWFGNPAEVRKEKVAEIQIMIQEGNIEAAKEALKKYNDFAKEYEKEISPQERTAAEESSRAIRSAIKKIEENIPEEERKPFTDIIDQEERIEKAAEVANKIQTLCEELAELDPAEFYRVCKTKEDGPQWQQELFEDLSEKQEQEAKQFFRVMGACFKGPENCDCNAIPHKAFANLCSEVKPLATKCETGDEEACEKMDEKTKDVTKLLADAPHLQRVLTDLERFEEDKFEHHLPKECEEAGATTQIECEQVFFKKDAPKECVDALEAKEFEFTGDHEAHKHCEKILYEVHAPKECKEKGIENHEECGKLLWELYTPKECKEAGLTGERQSDQQKCDEIMKNLHEQTEQTLHNNQYYNYDCRDIKNPEERLNCYDNILIKEFESERFEEEHEYEKEHKEKADEETLYEHEHTQTELQGAETHEKQTVEEEKTEEKHTDEEQHRDEEENSEGKSILTGNAIRIENAFYNYYYR